MNSGCGQWIIEHKEKKLMRIGPLISLSSKGTFPALSLSLVRRNEDWLVPI